MDNIHVDDVVLDKKFDGYNFERINYIAPREITITITREEYASLIESKATREYAIKKAEEDRFLRNQENEKLKNENEKLMAEMYELKKQLDATREELKNAGNAGSNGEG